MKYRFGVHMSIAGGLHLAAQRAQDAGCDCVQIFTKNNNQWGCKPLADSECTQFLAAVQAAHLEAPIAHASYLINLASPDPMLWQKSLDALIVEWLRCEQLHLEGLVIHPGAHTTSTPAEGLQRIVEAVQAAVEQVAPSRCRLLLENTAGQGSCLGWQIEQLGWLLHTLHSPHVGICWDTCHALAAGYDFRTAKGLSGRSAAWLARYLGVVEVVGSNPAGPIFDSHAYKDATYRTTILPGVGCQVDQGSHCVPGSQTTNGSQSVR
jgi:deoxyribonuclease IV